MFNFKIFDYGQLLEAVVPRNQYKTPDSSSHAASLGFLGCCLFGVWILAKFGFGLQHFDVPEAVEVHWFRFGCLRRLSRLRGGRRRRGEALSSGAGFEDVDVLDPATSQLGGIGTGGSYLQVDFLNPPR